MRNAINPQNGWSKEWGEVQGGGCTTSFTSGNENHQHRDVWSDVMERAKRRGGGSEIRRRSTSVSVFPFSTRRMGGGGDGQQSGEAEMKRGAYSVKASNAVQKFLIHHASSPPPFPPISDSSASWSSPCGRVKPLAGPPLG